MKNCNQCGADLPTSHPLRKLNKGPLEKAFGGCTECYGKGYSTTKVQAGSRRYGYKDMDPMHFCSCNRGQQLKEHIDRIEGKIRSDEANGCEAHRKKDIVKTLNDLLLKSETFGSAKGIRNLIKTYVYAKSKE